MQMTGVEINKKAAEISSNLERVKIYNMSALNFETEQKFDLTFTCGVLIHINPDELPTMYDKLYHFSKCYILIAEYYNPTPVEVIYRQNKGKLFKRDFAGEMMDKFPDLTLISYGFVYHRDNNFPTDDVNWFLFKKCYGDVSNYV